MMFVFFKILDYDHAKGFARERGIPIIEVNAINIENRMRTVKRELKRTVFGKKNGKWNKIPKELLE
jgi:hypothetical protein